MTPFLDGLREKSATTDPGAADPTLRGRTYAIPFDTVWQAALAVCGGGIRGWSLVRANDQEGVVLGLVQPGPISKHVDVRIEVGLDPNGQTRVDLTAESRGDRGDFGRARRLVGRFLQTLDRELGAGPETILDPEAVAAFVESVRSPASPDEDGDR